ncbi:unnamed protein product [Mytilus coruscus]|uniref:Uncharacterized protein n=1 Tax=Mytilus coruscus TaxID=42192 RepID=A0A6J8DNB1_MYTCO|nr:unnamed protein product [Mytilus coruscus]
MRYLDEFRNGPKLQPKQSSLKQDVEAKAKLELEKIQTMRELETAEAKSIKFNPLVSEYIPQVCVVSTPVESTNVSSVVNPQLATNTVVSTRSNYPSSLIALETTLNPTLNSDTTFVLDETRRALGLCGTDVKLSVSTMHTGKHIVESCKTKGRVVRGCDSELKTPLPNVSTRDIMPANRSHNPTAEMERRWSYLEHIVEKLMQVRDCGFILLIGYTCPRAFISREVIPSINNGPYGQKTDLGWEIVGIV